MTEDKNGSDAQNRGGEPDVLLDAPQLKVDELNLDLLKILKLEVKGLEAELNLRVDLSNLVGLLNRVVDTVGGNRDALQALIDTLGNTLKEAGSEDDLSKVVEAANGGSEADGDGMATARTPGETVRGSSLLRESTSDRGRSMRRSVNESGDVIEATLDEAGEVMGEKIAGNVANFLVEEEYTDEAGQTVQRVSDNESGRGIERVLDGSGGLVAFRVLGSSAPNNGEGRVDATQVAEMKAGRFGIGLASVEGTGSEGRVTAADVEEAAENSG